MLCRWGRYCNRLRMCIGFMWWLCLHWTYKWSVQPCCWNWRSKNAQGMTFWQVFFIFRPCTSFSFPHPVMWFTVKRGSNIQEMGISFYPKQGSLIKKPRNIWQLWTGKCYPAATACYNFHKFFVAGHKLTVTFLQIFLYIHELFLWKAKLRSETKNLWLETKELETILTYNSCKIDTH